MRFDMDIFEVLLHTMQNKPQYYVFYKRQTQKYSQNNVCIPSNQM